MFRPGVTKYVLSHWFRYLREEGKNVPQPRGTTDLIIRRLDGDRLTIDGYPVARSFFRADPSSVGEKSFDALAGRGNPTAIEIADVEALNRSMRTRSRHSDWDAVIDGDMSWLQAIPMNLDLLSTTPAAWEQAGGNAIVERAYRVLVGKHRRYARVGKMLHLKRPLLFPVLDSFVAQVLGISIPQDGNDEAVTTSALQLTWEIRRQGQANLTALLEIQRRLLADGIDRGPLRILDAALWFSHPAASVPGVARQLAVGMP